MLLFFSLSLVVWCTRFRVFSAVVGWGLGQSLFLAALRNVGFPEVTPAFQPGIQALKSSDTDPAWPSSEQSSLVAEWQKIKDLNRQSQFPGWVISNQHKWWSLRLTACIRPLAFVSIVKTKSHNLSTADVNLTTVSCRGAHTTKSCPDDKQTSSHRHLTQRLSYKYMCSALIRAASFRVCMLHQPRLRTFISLQSSVSAFGRLLPGEHGQLLGAVVVVVVGSVAILPLFPASSLHPSSGGSCCAGSPPLVGVSMRHGCHLSKQRTPPSRSKAAWRGTLWNAMRKFTFSSFVVFRNARRNRWGNGGGQKYLCIILALRDKRLPRSSWVKFWQRKHIVDVQWHPRKVGYLRRCC